MLIWAEENLFGNMIKEVQGHVLFSLPKPSLKLQVIGIRIGFEERVKEKIADGI